MKTIEEKIYEALGVKYFKRFLIWIQYIIFKPSGLDINKRFQYGTNYFISGGSIEKLKRFRFGILFNTLVHVWSLYSCISSIVGGITGIGSIITLTLSTIINVYCLMLQRYNNIRLERTIKEKEKHIKLLEERKKQKDDEQTLTESKAVSRGFSYADLYEKYGEYFANLKDENLKYTEPFDKKEESSIEETDEESPIKMVMKR